MKLFLSIVLGLLAAFFAAVLVAALSTGPEGVSALSLGPVEVPVAVATRALPAGHVLVEDNVKVKKIPSSSAPTGAVGAVANLVGRTLIRPVVVGQAITVRSIAGTGTGPEIESMLVEGYRASTITLADRGPGTFVYPGSLVDVISIFEVPRGYEDAGQTVSRTVLQGVKVLAVEGFYDAQKQAAAAASGSKARGSSRGPTITLLVTPTQAQLLQLARNIGSLSVTLRPNDEAERGMTQTLTLERMLDLREAKALPTHQGAPRDVVILTRSESVDESKPGEASEEEPEAEKVETPPRRWTTTVIRGHSRSTYTFEEAE